MFNLNWSNVIAQHCNISYCELHHAAQNNQAVDLKQNMKQITYYTPHGTLQLLVHRNM